MLRVTKAMLNKAGELMNDASKKHIKDDKYDYWTDNHETVAVTLNAGSTRKVGRFNCDDFVIIDGYDFR